MPRVIPEEKLNGAKAVERIYEAPKAPEKVPVRAEKNDDSLKLVAQLIERLPGMIASAVKTPVVTVEAPKAPEVKVSSPVYVTPPEVNVPQAPEIRIPEGKAPVVHVSPPEVHLSVSRPNKWHFDIHRNEYGQMTTIDAEAR